MAIVLLAHLLHILILSNSLFLAFTGPTSLSYSEQFRRGEIRSCPDDKFKCQDGTCIPGNRRCDNIFDCPAHEDEKDCICASGEMQCLDGTCLKMKSRCNGYYDCKGGEDELHCKCPPNKFKCKVDGNCIPLKQKCNNFPDCNDKTDEKECESLIHLQENKVDEMVKLFEDTLRRYLKTYLARAQVDQNN